MNNNGKKPVNFFKKSADRIKKKADRIYHDYDEKRARRDIIFTETIHKKEEPKEERVLVRSGIDIQFLVTVIALLAFGAMMSFSASHFYAEDMYGDSFYFLKHYIFFALIATAGTAFFVVYANPRFWKMFSFGVYGLSVVMLLLVLVIGTSGGGAQRWIEVGPITIQPSEIAKMAVIMMLALYMSHYQKEISSDHVFGGSVRHGVISPGLIIGIIIVLVMLEKHISGVMIIGMIGIAVMYLGGTKTKWIFLIFGVIAFAGAFLILVSSYAQDRVYTWLFIEQVDPLGSAWQTLQGLYAIGSGGIFGLGLGNSRQKYGYVSQPQNDFIFTIICEELGFVGAVLILSLFGFLIWRGFKIASRASDRFSQLVAYGLTVKLALQVILNIAVVTNSMPNTGISLPFFSSGGTALAVQIFEMGIILSISRYSSKKV
ncbi:MAG: cell division protein FtsW [Ruminococcaceae bacterium]|nr:cell division protein FtsW [Oscillospiraceae bacterium]